MCYFDSCHRYLQQHLFCHKFRVVSDAVSGVNRRKTIIFYQPFRPSNDIHPDEQKAVDKQSKFGSLLKMLMFFLERQCDTPGTPVPPHVEGIYRDCPASPNTQSHKTQRDIVSTITKLCQQSNRLWSIINSYSPKPSKYNFTHDLIQMTTLLEEHIQLSLSVCQSKFQMDQVLSDCDKLILSFYALPEIHPRQLTFASSVSSQIYLNTRKRASPPKKKHCNYFSPLSIHEPKNMTMDIEEPTNDKDKSSLDLTQYEVVSWTLDSNITAISEDIFSEIKHSKDLADNAGEMDHPSITYEPPKDTINTSKKLNQRICFNFMCHPGTNSDIPTIKLFKSFTSTFCSVDSSLVNLPYQVSKQHYSSLSSLKQISLVDEPKMLQFFKLYLPTSTLLP